METQYALNWGIGNGFVCVTQITFTPCERYYIYYSGKYWLIYGSETFQAMAAGPFGKGRSEIG